MRNRPSFDAGQVGTLSSYTTKGTPPDKLCTEFQSNNKINNQNLFSRYLGRILDRCSQGRASPPWLFASRTIPSFDGDHDDGDVDHDVGGGDHDVGDDENAPFILEDNISHVIVRYEGSYFPGIVKQVRKTTTRVSCMIKCGPSTWK